MELSLDDCRAAWARGQGLLARRPAGELAGTVAATGWLRTIGGAEAYLALAARAEGVTARAVHEAIRAGELRVVPAARGCIYLVGAEEADLAVRLAAHVSSRRLERDVDKAGSSLAELESMFDVIAAALEDGALTTRELRSALPKGSVRSLGAAGKRVGLTSPLPPALRWMEFRGLLRRVPVDDRIDHERYLWARDDGFGTQAPDDPSELLASVAARFLRWAAPATRKELASWTGMTQAEAKKALAAIGAQAVVCEALGGEAFVPADFAPPDDAHAARLALLPALDNLFAMRLNTGALVDPAHHDVEISSFGRGASARIGDCGQPLDRTLARGAHVIGTWAYDPSLSQAELHPFEKLERRDAGDLEAERAAATALLRELGHGRATVLDTDETLRARLERMRERA